MASGQDVWQEEGEPFTRITPKAASEMLADGNVQLIDVRNQDEWDAGHVPGATLIRPTGSRTLLPANSEREP